MNPSPISNPFDDEESYTRSVRLAILGFGLFVCLGLSALGFIRYQAQVFSLYGQYFPTTTVTHTAAPTLTATRTSTPTTTFTSTPNLTATQSAYRITRTALAFQLTATQVASQWQEIFSEPFDNNHSQWPVDAQDDEYSKTTFEIKDSRYRLNSISRQSFIYWVPIASKDLENFSLTIEAGLVEYSSSIDSGIIFRWDNQGNLYYFAIDSDQRYSLYKLLAGEWSTLIEPTETPLVKKDGMNQLAVIVQGDHFILFINEQFVADKHDDSIKKGTTALAIEVFQPGETAIFDFDNIVLRAP
jgi:hypothetical protein